MSYELSEASKNVRAIMKLRGVSIHEICRHTGIQAENLQAWLRGVKEALSDSSYISLMSFLGIDAKQDKEQVHVWRIPVKNGDISKDYTDALRFAAASLLKDAKIAELNIGKCERFKQKRVFIIRSSNNLRITLVLKGGFRKPRNLILQQDLPNTSWLKDQNPLNIDKTYANTAKNETLTASEINDILNDECQSVSWADLRLIARERGVTPTNLMQWIMDEEVADVEEEEIILQNANVIMQPPITEVKPATPIFELEKSIEETKEEVVANERLSPPRRNSRTTRSRTQ